MARLPASAGGRRAEDYLHPVERMLERMLSPTWRAEPWRSAPTVTTYPVDMREEGGKIIVDAELPGFTGEQIDIQIQGDVLQIRAERSREEARGTSHLNERSYTRVQRTLTLPAEVDENQVDARLRDGVLHLEMAELKPRGSRRIPIST